MSNNDIRVNSFLQHCIQTIFPNGTVWYFYNEVGKDGYNYSKCYVSRND